MRYVLTEEEDKAFKALKTDEERGKAIAVFWARRDPTPGTPANEYKDAFYKRVEDANKEFKETTTPGWTTDRGRVLLVAGYPKERKEEEAGETWSYQNLVVDLDSFFAAADAAAARSDKANPLRPPDPGTRSSLKQTFTGLSKVSFLKNESGDFALDAGSGLLNEVRKLDPLWAAMISLPGDVLVKVRASAAPAGSASLAPGGSPASGTTPGGGAGTAAPAGGGTQAGGGGAPGSPAEIPESVARLKQAALAPAPKNEIGMMTSVRYFKAEDGSARTVVMVALKKADVAPAEGQKPQMVLYASFLPQGVPDAAPVEFTDQELFTVYDDAAEGWLKCTFAWALKKSKTYELRVAASDGPAGKIATHTETFTLPDFKSDTLMLSSVTLAHSAQPLDPAAPAESEDKDRFRVGSLRLIPWVKPILTPKDDLAFFYDVYNAKRDAATNKPQLDVTYTLESKDPGKKRRGKLEDFGKQEERLGYTIPADTLAQWPAGDYHLTIQVKDKIAGTQTSGSLDFSIVK